MHMAKGAAQTKFSSWSAVTGNDFIADIYLPERFARLIPLVCGGLALIGILSVLVRLLIGG